MKKKATYLLPIWVDIYCHGDPKDILIDLNEKLTEFFEKYGDLHPVIAKCKSNAQRPLMMGQRVS